MTIRGLTLISLCISTQPANAGNLTGNDILETCSAKDRPILEAFCSGYVIGVVEGTKWGAALAFSAAAGGEDSTAELNYVVDQFLGTCAPEEVQYSQFKDVLVKYLLENPSIRHESARTLAKSALNEAFPCE